MKEPAEAARLRVSGGAEDGRSQGGADRLTGQDGVNLRQEVEPLDLSAQALMVVAGPEA